MLMAAKAEDLPKAYPKEDREAEGIARCAELIRRAILTHDALPGEKLAQLVADSQMVRSFNESYGYDDVRPPKFAPTPRDVSNMLPVLEWLCQHRQENNGGRDFKVLLCRARDVPWWKLAMRFGRSERTVKRWFDGAVTAIYLKHSNDVWSRAK